MAILNRTEIIRRIEVDNLIVDPRKDESGKLSVEPASYDLRVGIAVWKNEKTQEISQKTFKDGKELQEPITLKPGQMVFVITHEELKLPSDVSATVYSRNQLQKQNILALNAGHVDPGYEGAIMIRLINLGSESWSLTLGQQVFTAVFHTVQPGLKVYERRTKEEWVRVAIAAANQAFSNPFHDLYEAQVKKQLDEYYLGVETRLRDKFQEEFFRKNRVVEFLVYSIGAILLGLAVITRIPWGEVWKCIKWFLGR